MKRAVGLMIFAGVLILLTLGWFLAGEMTTSSPPASTTTAAVPVKLIDFTGNITGIAYDYDDERLAFTLEEDTWRYAPDPTVPIQQKLVQSMAETLSELQVMREIEPVAGENYGFGEDSFAVCVTTDARETHTLTFGGINPATSQVYVRLDDVATLFLLDAAVPAAFDYRFLDLIRCDAAPNITPDELDGLTIERDGHKLALSYHAGGLPTAYSDAFEWFIGHPYKTLTAADTKLAHALFTDITNLYIYGCAAFRPDEATLAEMGLAEPQATITIDHRADGAAAKTTLYVGGTSPDEYAYIRFDDSEQVLLADAGLLKSVIYTSASSLLPKAVCLVEQESVTSFTVEAAGESHIYSRTADGWSRDGEAYEAEFVSNFFYVLGNLASVADAPDTKPTETYASIRFRRTREGFEDMALTFHSFDDQRLLVGFDGRLRLLIDRSDVDALLQILEGESGMLQEFLDGVDVLPYDS